MTFYIKNLSNFLFDINTKDKEGPGIKYDTYEVKDFSPDIITANYICPECNHIKVYLEHLPILKKDSQCGHNILCPSSNSGCGGKEGKSCSNLAYEKVNHISRGWNSMVISEHCAVLIGVREEMSVE